MKPISELVNDRKACERIFRFFFGKRMLKEVKLLVNEEAKKEQVLLVAPGKIYGRKTVVKIRQNGSVSQAYEMEYNPFAFVALMNELGYRPTEAKKLVKGGVVLKEGISDKEWYRPMNHSPEQIEPINFGRLEAYIEESRSIGLPTGGRFVEQSRGTSKGRGRSKVKKGNG